MKNRRSTGKEDPSQLTILGVYIKSDAYPNVKYKVTGLLQAKNLMIREINFPLDFIQRIGRQRSGILTFTRLIGSALRFGYAHIRIVLSAIHLDHPSNLYIPYPAVFVLYLLSFFPKRWRPNKICIDAFISIYDTVVEDRKLVSPRNPFARLLYAIEKRAYQNADLILVDTEQNSLYLSSTFKVPVERVMALPLSINEEIYAPDPYIPQANRCNVLFIGTFVPLQGVEVIAKAITLLRTYQNIHFHLIGDGQTSKNVAAILGSTDLNNVSWERHWQDTTTLAGAIKQSDICLGIFGNSEKCQRVWPLKNYAYMAIGRAIITADTNAARTILTDCEKRPFMTIPADGPEELARAIVQLANDPEQRVSYAEASRLYYEQHLSNAVSINKLLQSLSS